MQTLQPSIPPTLFQSGKRDSNPRPQPWQGCALPTELFPRKEAPSGPLLTLIWSGGEGNRTPDLVNAIHALSQLSYAPSILRAAEGTSLQGNMASYPGPQLVSSNLDLNPGVWCKNMIV